MWKTSYDKAALKRSRRKINRKKSDIFPKHRRNKKSVSRSTLPVSESISTFLSRQKLSDDEEPHQHPVEEDYDMEEEDDEYVFRGDGQSSTSLRKGRNVDKACNHCKRSHLRCDNMRPCRRCVATGKTGCKDVEHKPRGRPRLNKNQHNVKNRGL
ncbi:hypothetical protein BJV82DRAFT_623562 [Fennellomyces sp. T-0311]|nr:hypothetical protein BJV82DRAFT_623562 [Fennellomyces sp. T-0311]